MSDSPRINTGLDPADANIPISPAISANRNLRNYSRSDSRVLIILRRKFLEYRRHSSRIRINASLKHTSTCLANILTFPQYGSRSILGYLTYIGKLSHTIETKVTCVKHRQNIRRSCAPKKGNRFLPIELTINDLQTSRASISQLAIRSD